MSADDSAIGTGSRALAWGITGVTAFSFTVPMTRIATGGLPALFVGSGRAVVAAVLAAIALAVTRQHWPSRRQVARLVVTGGGIVAGFPLLTTYALETIPASHGAVVIAMLPAVTAVTVVLRTRERPPAAFWLVAALGAAAAIGFALVESGGVDGLQTADLLLFAAVFAAAIGYAEGGLLARELGAWQTISWALLVCGPAMVTLSTVSVTHDRLDASGTQWAAFAYLGVISMFLGFVAWYRGLALGPMARISQVQLVQPVLSIAWAALLLHEPLTPAVLVGGTVVVACAAAAVRVRTAAQPAAALSSTECVSPSSNSTPPTRPAGYGTG